MNTATLQHILIAWRLGTRSHAMRALLAFGVFLLAIAFLAGAFSPRQPLVVTLDIGISGIRLLTALLTLFWMQDTFGRDIERRTLTLAFAQPVDRTSYVIGRFIGVMLLVTVAVLLWGIALAVADQFASWGYGASSKPHLSHYGLVLLGIVVDAWVIGAFVLALTSVAETPLLPFLAGAGFAIAARSIGAVLNYMVFSESVDLDLQYLAPTLRILRWLVPDLGQLDWREAVLYGQDFPWTKAWTGLAIMGGYTLLFLIFAILAYRKRELS